MALAFLAIEGRGSADPAQDAPKARSTQIYQGELDGREVWVELTRTAQGISGKLGRSLLNESALATLELPPQTKSDGPAAFIPQRLDAIPCLLRVEGTHSPGIKSACLRSMQGATFLADGFPELIVEDDPTSASSPGTQFWLRAVAPESAANLAEFADPLRRAEPPGRNACARSVRVDQIRYTEAGSFLAYWTWDFCGAAVLAAARAGKADPGKGSWRETAWLGMVDMQGRFVAHVAVGQRAQANDQLRLVDLGRVDGLNLVHVEQRYQDAYPTGLSEYSQTRLYAATDHGRLTLALGPLLSHETSGNCSGSDLETRWFPVPRGPQLSDLKELIVRTKKTDRIKMADSCEARDRMTYRGYRFKPQPGKYTDFYRPDFAEIVQAHERP